MLVNTGVSSKIEHTWDRAFDHFFSFIPLRQDFSTLTSLCYPGLFCALEDVSLHPGLSLYIPVALPPTPVMSIKKVFKYFHLSRGCGGGDCPWFDVLFLY